MYSYAKYSGAPDIVRQFCQLYDAFIVGGSAKYLMGLTEECKDWDVIVPLSKWGQAQKLIPKAATHNTFGGSKIYDNCFHSVGTTVDVWSCDLSEYLCGNMHTETYIVHPKSLFSGRFDYGFDKHKESTSKKLQTTLHVSPENLEVLKFWTVSLEDGLKFNPPDAKES